MIKILLQFYKLRSRKKSNRYILAMLYNISLIPENIRCKRHYIIFFHKVNKLDVVNIVIYLNILVTKYFCNYLPLSGLPTNLGVRKDIY